MFKCINYINHAKYFCPIKSLLFHLLWQTRIACNKRYVVEGTGVLFRPVPDLIVYRGNGGYWKVLLIGGKHVKTIWRVICCSRNNDLSCTFIEVVKNKKRKDVVNMSNWKCISFKTRFIFKSLCVVQKGLLNVFGGVEFIFGTSIKSAYVCISHSMVLRNK